ncbi:MAG: M20/M25/M40 family metallo-hydrolase [Desulfobacterales bacterium]
MDINRNRLAESFAFLVGINSPSRSENAVAREIEKILISLGAETVVDDAGDPSGSDTGNLIARIKGDMPVAPLMLNAHMDTVGTEETITPILEDGIFTSDGTTILGADDKSAIAIIIEALNVLKEKRISHGPLELVFTICEEIGLVGAKNLDTSLITATFGYALDTTGTEGIITRAPAANRLTFKIHGKSAHAGVAPEQGINAISLASKAIANLTIGRIDHETTCNIGVIEGGTGTNIVPDLVTVRGEVRSHDNDKLDRVTATIISSFESVIESYPASAGPDAMPTLETVLEKDFPLTHIPDNHPVVVLAQQAADNLGHSLTPERSGGGADANIFFEKGIITGVLGTGMMDMHTVRESIRLDDMVKTTQLVLEIIQLHSHNPIPSTPRGQDTT